MSIDEATATRSEQDTCVVDAQYPYFFISEGTDLVNPGVLSHSGMVNASPGKVKLQVPWIASQVRVVTEIRTERPATELDTYEDVIEFGYRSATGLAAILDWTRKLSCEWDPLPIGAGDYRLRYHVRDGLGHAADGDTPKGSVAEALIQIWPGGLGELEELKISSAFGHFWHPGSRLRDVWNFPRV
ncbi:hypothetical protein [Amycolatopsis thailandensis]|uniref:hypothetical protein n=1 Tax=Amycolatopsis thailandensis TaxID=589330 RepID=UPI00362F60D2